MTGTRRSSQDLTLRGSSQESWERFRDETLMPTMSAGIDGGFPTPPQETAFPVSNQQTG